MLLYLKGSCIRTRGSYPGALAKCVNLVSLSLNWKSPEVRTRQCKCERVIVVH